MTQPHAALPGLPGLPGLPCESTACERRHRLCGALTRLVSLSLFPVAHARSGKHGVRLPLRAFGAHVGGHQSSRGRRRWAPGSARCRVHPRCDRLACPNVRRGAPSGAWFARSKQRQRRRCESCGRWCCYDTVCSISLDWLVILVGRNKLLGSVRTRVRFLLVAWERVRGGFWTRSVLGMQHARATVVAMPVSAMPIAAAPIASASVRTVALDRHALAAPVM